jgi:hypothetical protein
MIHQRIAGPIETDRRAIGTEHGQVGNAAQVQHADRHALIKQRAVKRRHERCAVPAAGRGTVGHDGDAAQLGEQGRVEDLDRVAERVEFTRPVAHRLPVRADGGHGLRAEPGFA